MPEYRALRARHSLLELCRPKALERPRRVTAWLARMVEGEG